jgi:recombination protein RecA
LHGVTVCVCGLWQGDIGNQLVGSQARLMSQALRKLASSASKARCTIIFINQIRFKVGAQLGKRGRQGGGGCPFFLEEGGHDLLRPLGLS